MPGRPVFGASLRARLAIGVALPLLGILSIYSVVHFLRSQRLLEDQLRVTATQLGSVMTGGLRHAMLLNDGAMLESVLTDIGEMEAIDRVSILDNSGIVRFDTAASQVGEAKLRSEPGCVECHAFAPADRPRTVLLDSPQGILRIAAPILNEPACFVCHTSAPPHLGILLADAPLQALEAGLVADLTVDLAASVGVAIAISAGVYFLVHRLIVRRLESMQGPLAAFAGGDLRQRLSADGSRQDEIGRLSAAFNTMASRLETSRQQEFESRRFREEAAYRERERIARELHDGLAQILAYVRTKAVAVRMLLAQGKAESAEVHLGQLEEAAGEVLVDVRQAILGLRLTSRPELDLGARLRTFAEQFSRLSGVPVRVELPDGSAYLGLTAEAEVELLRIVQEAFSNIRKHAAADGAWVRLRRTIDGVELTVGDDGTGFDPAPGAVDPLRFGLESMQQRALSIGARLRVETEPGNGTRVTVCLTDEKEGS